MSEFSGRVEALALAIQSLSISGVQSTQKDVEIVRQTLDDHEKLLRHCLVFCTTALSAAQTVLPGTQVKHAKALNHARQIVGNFGPLGKNAPPVVVDTAEAQDAFQAVGNIDLRGLDTRALDFLAGK